MATTARGYPYPIAGDPANVAGDLNALATAIDADVTALGTWTSYVPTWTASAGTPSIGNGTLTGRYSRNNKTVNFSLRLFAGGTTTYGTAGATWTFGLPALGNTANRFCFSLWLEDIGTQFYTGVATVGAGSALLGLRHPVSGSMTNTNPFTFGNGDLLSINGTYELA